MFIKTLRNFGLATSLTVTGSAAALAASTQDVWNHHVDAWVAKSVADIVVDYTDDSVLVLNNQVFKGQQQIAHVFTQLFQIFANGANRIDTPLIFDRFVYITWHLDLKGEPEFFGTDTFVIENGKIVLQTIASPLYQTYPIYPLTK